MVKASVLALDTWPESKVIFDIGSPKLLPINYLFGKCTKVENISFLMSLTTLAEIIVKKQLMRNLQSPFRERVLGFLLEPMFEMKDLYQQMFHLRLV